MIKSILAGATLAGVAWRYSGIKERKIVELRRSIRKETTFSRSESVREFFGLEKSYSGLTYSAISNKFIIDMACEENDPRILRKCSELTVREKTYIASKSPTNKFFVESLHQKNIHEDDIKQVSVLQMSELLKISELRESMKDKIINKASKEEIKDFAKENRQYFTVSVENEIKKFSHKYGYWNLIFDRDN